MQVAITGSSGLIGTALTRSLVADGHTVIRLVRDDSPPSDTTAASSPAAADESPAGQVHSVRWDPERGEIDGATLEGVDAVVHLAGAGVGDKRWTAERKALILDSRVNGTTTLANALATLDRRPEVLVSAAGVHYYGDRGDEVLTEASEPGGGFLAGVVAAWEEATSPAQEAGIRMVRARSGLVLSTTGGAFPKLLTQFRLGVGGRMGSGQQWWSWITLADEIAALRFLIDGEGPGKTVSGPVNVVSPNPVTNQQLTKALGKALHRPTVIPTPKLGPRLVLGKEMADEMLFMSQRAHPKALLDAGFHFQHADIDTALRAVLHP